MKFKKRQLQLLEASLSMAYWHEFNRLSRAIDSETRREIKITIAEIKTLEQKIRQAKK
jgi:hypothetical protein